MNALRRSFWPNRSSSPLPRKRTFALKLGRMRCMRPHSRL
nr:MAG TPA: hypothetical protein [Caudoviricetes sp.]